MIYTKKKGYISIEYVIVAGMVLAACAFIFVRNFPGYTAQVNHRAINIVDILSSDETTD